VQGNRDYYFGRGDQESIFVMKIGEQSAERASQIIPAAVFKSVYQFFYAVVIPAGAVCAVEIKTFPGTSGAVSGPFSGVPAASPAKGRGIPFDGTPAFRANRVIYRASIFEARAARQAYRRIYNIA
jgi:hypothetical protein